MQGSWDSPSRPSLRDEPYNAAVCVLLLQHRRAAGLQPEAGVLSLGYTSVTSPSAGCIPLGLVFSGRKKTRQEAAVWDPPRGALSGQRQGKPLPVSAPLGRLHPSLFVPERLHQGRCADSSGCLGGVMQHFKSFFLLQTKLILNPLLRARCWRFCRAWYCSHCYIRGLRRMLNVIFLIKDLCLRLPCFIAAVHLHNPNFYLPDVEGKMFTATWSGMWIFLPKQM